MAMGDASAMSGVDVIRVVENRWSVVWEPGQYTTLATWYPLDRRLGLTHPNQSASHVSKNRELWLPFLPWPVSQSEMGTSLGQGNGRLGCGFSSREDSARTPRIYLNPWLIGFIYSTEYIYSVSLAFRDQRRRIVVAFSNQYTQEEHRRNPLGVPS